MLIIHWLSIIDCGQLLNIHPKILGVFFVVTAALFLSLLLVLMDDLRAKFCL